MLSGIVALFFTAICHAHYSYYSVEAESQISLRAFFEVAAFLSETFVFIYLGLQVCAPLKMPVLVTHHQPHPSSEEEAGSGLLVVSP